VIDTLPGLGLYEGNSAQIRDEHTIALTPPYLVRSNGFGSISGVAPPRTLQLVTRLTF